MLPVRNVQRDSSAPKVFAYSLSTSGVSRSGSTENETSFTSGRVTCFCTSVEDSSDLTGEHAERWELWDSCFDLDFSYLHGGSVRTSPKSRYRQWLTHKLGTWHDQFGSSGCVGCGRCISWCPVGIDVTEELAALRVGGEVSDAED